MYVCMYVQLVHTTAVRDQTTRHEKVLFFHFLFSPSGWLLVPIESTERALGIPARDPSLPTWYHTGTKNFQALNGPSDTMGLVNRKHSKETE